MKKAVIIATVIGFLGLPSWLWAQEDVKKDKETEEVIIRNKGDKEMKVTVEINGDKIIVNGKPLAEFKDDQITIDKRKMIIRDGEDMVISDGNKMLLSDGEDMMMLNLDNGAQIFGVPEDLPNQGKNSKEVTKPFLGVTTEKVDDGAKVTEVVEGSAAEKAGLKKGDIITNIDNDKVSDGESLAKIIKERKPKEDVKIHYLRNGKKSNAKATLGERKEKRSMAFSFKGNPNDMMKYFNFPAPPMPPEMDEDGNVYDMPPMPRQKKLGLKIQDTEEGGNVKVIDVDDESAAATAGLKEGDLITEIAGNKINNTDDAREQLKPVEGKNSYTIKAKRGGKEMTFEVKIPKKLKTANL